MSRWGCHHVQLAGRRTTCRVFIYRLYRSGRVWPRSGNATRRAPSYRYRLRRGKVSVWADRRTPNILGAVNQRPGAFARNLPSRRGPAGWSSRRSITCQRDARRRGRSSCAARTGLCGSPGNQPSRCRPVSPGPAACIPAAIPTANQHCEGDAAGHVDENVRGRWSTATDQNPCWTSHCRALDATQAAALGLHRGPPL